MKVSEFLRKYQITGSVPQEAEADSDLCFWAGWLLGSASRSEIRSKEQSIQFAINAAEFIEERAGK
jgi:hypothetical protein